MWRRWEERGVWRKVCEREVCGEGGRKEVCGGRFVRGRYVGGGVLREREVCGRRCVEREGGMWEEVC